MQGIYLVDKPSGMTSFDVIRILQKKFGRKKIGHAGTLDPLASGLLIIAFGHSTKKLTDFIKLPKVYRADILLGVRTDTGDMRGTILETADTAAVSEVSVQKILSEMVGRIELPVPLYSAKKVGGKRLYKHAFKGNPHGVVPPTVTMEVRNVMFEGLITDGARKIIKVVLDVGSGTYIRSLAEEYGKRLGVPAAVSALRRISVGNYSVENAVPAEDVGVTDAGKIVE